MVPFACAVAFRQLKSFPIPRTENLFEDLKGAEVFTVLDLKSTYWQIPPINESNKKTTAFVIPKGKFHWTVCFFPPFGIRDASFSLAYVMYQLLDKFNFSKSFYCIIGRKGILENCWWSRMFEDIKQLSLK